MSRGNVFKLSGNMALNSNNPYPAPDISEIKNSLKLLKSKQNQRKPNEDNFNSNYPYQDIPYNNNPKSEQIQRANQNTQNYNQPYKKIDSYAYDLDILSKNHIPSYKDSSYKQIGKDKSYQNANQNAYNSREKKNESKQSNQYDEIYQQNNRGSVHKKQGKPSIEQNYNYQKPSVNIPQREPPMKNYRQQQSSYNYPAPVQKTIKQANRDNKVDIVQYNPKDFIQCSEGCGRKFNPDSISKHQAICKKVFQKKRKEFNAQAHRIVEKDQIKLMKKGEIAQKKIQEKKKKQKMSKWKAQSLAFRAVLKEGRSNLTDEDKNLIQQSKQAGQIKCPYCGRTFNETAGPRHITFCENQQKKLNSKIKK